MLHDAHARPGHQASFGLKLEEKIACTATRRALSRSKISYSIFSNPIFQHAKKKQKTKNKKKIECTVKPKQTWAKENFS